MRVIQVRNVHAALPEGLRLLSEYGVLKDSRAGKVLVAPWPVMTVYEKPLERVLFWPERDANPFFHLMEALWMLAGRNDVNWLTQFNSKMVDFSDNGRTFHGAYGYRWRNHFYPEDPEPPIDQLDMVVELLRRSPYSRRAVIQMWDPVEDLMVDESLSKDVPCNTQIYLTRQLDPENRIIPVDRLDMTVMCRSNDIIWGAYGANAVHFSILQEYLAARIGWRVGTLYQFSNNYHAYLDVFEKNKSLVHAAADPYRITASVWNPYAENEVNIVPLVDKPENFDQELSLFMEDDEYPNLYLDVEPSNKFLYYATLIKQAYLIRKDAPDEAMEILEDLPVCWDFGRACIEWLERKTRRGKELS